MTASVTTGLEHDWFPVARAADLVHGNRVRTRLLGRDVQVEKAAEETYRGSGGLALRERYGLVWACVDPAGSSVPDFAEADDPAYRSVLCGPFGVSTSGPRIIENFLDMAHFPYVHTGILGNEPHTEVPDYTVDEAPAAGGVIATDCVFWQPATEVLVHGGAMVRYTYRVPRPFMAIFNKLPQAAASHGVAILLAVQPAEPERSIAWMVFCTTNRQPTDAAIRANQDRVFLQDKPILENQIPACLPLDPRAEMPIRCDRLSVAYRRFLARSGVRFGVIAA